MTTRFHYFSHIENTTSGSLVLFDPFAENPADGLVCRYELHRAPVGVLDPDPGESGIAAWHALLPVPREKPLPQDPVLTLSPLNSAFARQCDALFQLTPHPQLERLIGQLMVENNSEPNYGLWGNPFRLEGLKLVGLEIQHRFRGQRPVLVVFDPTGERLYALHLAALCVQAFKGEIPWRVILVQQEPHVSLCRLFEGRQTQWDPSQTPTPDRFAVELVDHLTRHLGTAIAAPASGLPMDAAMALLLRTGFIDEEDQVILWD